jgi:chromosome segregation ATPase
MSFKFFDWLLADYISFKQAVLRSNLEKADEQIAALRKDLNVISAQVHTSNTKIQALEDEQPQLKDYLQRALQTLQAEQSTQQDALKLAVQSEFQRVGLAVAEIHTRFENLVKPEPEPTVETVQPSPLVEELSQRLDVIERLLSSMSDLSKPGNHIRPGHSFGNKVRL